MPRPRIVLDVLKFAAAGVRGGVQRLRSSPRRRLSVPVSPVPPVDMEAPVEGTRARLVTPPATLGRFLGYLGQLLVALGVIGFVVTIGFVVLSAAGVGPEATAIGDRSWLLLSALVTAGIWVVLLLWKVPQWQAASRAAGGELSTRELFDIENAARGTLGQMVSGLALLVGLYFAWQQLGNTNATINVSEQGQITDRFTRAVDQVGSDDLTVRLGGIYALERIAGDSERDYGPVMEVLTAYVRQASPRTDVDTAPLATPGPAEVPVDVQAVLSVLARRDASRDGPACLDLSGTNLAGVSLAGANLTNTCLAHVDLAEADLRGANLSDVDLTGADLSGAILEDADLSRSLLLRAVFDGAALSRADVTGANLTSARLNLVILDHAVLRGSILFGADLRGALLFDADLVNADLADANLTGAVMTGADLTGALHLTQTQIDAAVTDDRTKLPPNVQAHPDI